MQFSSRALSSSLLALSIAACGGSDNATDDTVTPPGTDTGAEPQTDTGEEDPTSTGVDPTTGDPPVDPTSGGVVDPCEACHADASCQGGTCECDDGFEGDGQSCTDIDECAGKNDCAVDATCSNTPGGHDCACNAGYKGNGFTCEDIDECNEDLDTCSPNADCANQDGGFKCTCKDGFVGDGMVCNGSKEFGESCEIGQDCASGLCLGNFDMCTVECTQDVANDCGDQGLTGLCVSVGNDLFVCGGDLTFGLDKDDEVLLVGDKIKRNFQSKTDADVFLVHTPLPGDYLVTLTPDPDDDIQIEFYGADASELGTLDLFGIGEPESGVITISGVFFVVARNVGVSNGAYTIEVVKQ